MFKFAKASLDETRDILESIRAENPKHWPNGLSADHFDGGLYLVREASTHRPAGFCGWQERWERGNDQALKKVGYYSIGILPEFRGNRLAKEAVSKLICMKSGAVDKVKALIMSDNTASIRLAERLPGVELSIKQAAQACNSPKTWILAYWGRR